MIQPDLPALFLRTSGSTAEPKLAVLSLANLLANAKGALSILDLKPNDRWLLNLPLFHVSGIGILMRCILAQATIAADEKDVQITHLSCVPTQLYRASPVYKNLRCLLLGGAPIHSYPNHLPVIVTYGLTEMGSMVLAKEKPINGYLGFALPNRDLKLNKDGEILVRGSCLFQGYWQDGKIQKPDDWFATKDIGTFDPIHGIKISGRKDWQFISGGENIQPEEIEKFLLTIPGIEEAAVLPYKDLEFGARPVAFIIGAVNPETIKKKLSKHLPKYKIPKNFLFLKTMPTKGLKIDRAALFNFLESKSFIT
jgi:O-succinylbenzoic acid--CoA ligase